MKSVRVRKGLYRQVHREEPRGTRTWGFAMGVTTKVIWVPNTPYEEAEREAVEKARLMRVDYVIVLP